jgi:hypothetical protein
MAKLKVRGPAGMPGTAAARFAFLIEQGFGPSLTSTIVFQVFPIAQLGVPSAVLQPLPPPLLSIPSAVLTVT